MKDCDSQIFRKPRSSKPFQIRLAEQVMEKSLLSQKILEIDHPNVPPWQIPQINSCVKGISKKTQSPEEIKVRFLEHDQVHKNYVKIYTDGSKSPNGVGCAVVHKDGSHVGKLSDYASVFTAELKAILEALKLINQSKYKKFVIYTDSSSAITALKESN